MPISKEMLEILCCPVSKVPVKMLPNDKLELVNRLIGEGKIKDISGSQVKEPLQEALVTADDKTIYRIDDDIPVMLSESGIHTDQLKS